MRRVALIALLAACGGEARSVDAGASAVDGAAGDAAGPDASTVCDPEAMPQPNQGLDEPAGAGGCPAGMVPVADFCIDRHEASLVLAGSGEPWSPYWNPGETLYAASLQHAVLLAGEPRVG